MIGLNYTVKKLLSAPLALLTILAIIHILLSGCNDNNSTDKAKISSLDDLNHAGWIIGGELGALSFNLAEQKFPKAKLQSFKLCMDTYPALAAGKIDALVFDRPAMEYAVLSYPQFVILPDDIAPGKISVGAPLKHTALMKKVNAFIAQYKKDGTYQQMYERWVQTKNSVMPEIQEAANPDGILKIGVPGDNRPMSFFADDGKLAGFGIEFAKRLALSLNMKCQLVNMDYNALFTACASGKIDLAVANMDVTAEPSKNMLFSDYYMESPISVMIRKNDYAGVKPPSDDAVARLNVPGKKIGVPQGAMAMNVGEKLFNKAKILYFGSLADGYAAVKYKKIDAFLFDRHSMTYVEKVTPELKLIPEDLAEEHIVIALPKKHEELLKKVNAFLKEYRSNGVYEDMYNRWILNNEHVMIDIPAPENPVMTLKVGTEGLNEPLNYFGKDGKVTGFDVELTKRLALFLNAELLIETMTYPGLLAAVESGRIDLMIANLNKKPECEKVMLLSDDYVDSAITAIVHADNFIENSASSEAINSLSDLQGKKAASITGSGFQTLTDPLQSGIQHVFYNDIHTCVTALRTGKVDAVLLDKPMSQMFAARFPEDTRFVCVYAKDYYGFAFRKDSPLTEKAGRVIQELKKSGEMEKIAKKWLGGKATKTTEWKHKKDFDGSAGVFRYASDPTQEPMCYFNDNGEPVGLDIEVMRRVAYELNMEFKFITMNFGALIEALLAKKADAVGGAMSITDERKKRVDFTECYYEGGLSILARRQSIKTELVPSIEILDGKRIGILSGTTFDTVIKERLPNAVPTYFNAFTDLPVALKAGKIEAFLLESPQIKLLQKQYPGMQALPDLLSNDEYAFIFARKNQALCDELSRQIRAMKADGTLEKLERKWFAGENVDLPVLKVDSPKRKLRFAVVPQIEPFAFMQNGKPAGYDLDVAQIAAARMGCAAIPVIMDFSSVVEAVAAGKVDFGASCITITEERKQKVLFSEPDYLGGIAVMVMKKTEIKQDAHKNSFLKELKDSFERTFLVESRWKLILEGLKITVLITVFSAVLGTILAFPVCYLRRSKHIISRAIGGVYVALLQGTPILVILMLLYYVVFAKYDIDAVIVAVIGFGLNFAAYTGEMLRTGIEAVPPGQVEAAKALSLTRFQTFRKIVFPQAARQILPVYRGEFINMLKTTSVVGYIAIQDLTKMSDIIRSRTYEAFFPLIATAVIYFAAAWLLASVLSYFEYRLTPGIRVHVATRGVSK